MSCSKSSTLTPRALIVASASYTSSSTTGASPSDGLSSRRRRGTAISARLTRHDWFVAERMWRPSYQQWVDADGMTWTRHRPRWLGERAARTFVLRTSTVVAVERSGDFDLLWLDLAVRRGYWADHVAGHVDDGTGVWVPGNSEGLTYRLAAKPSAKVRWLDLCCGSGTALLQAAQHLEELGIPGRVEITGIDLVDSFAGPPPPGTAGSSPRRSPRGGRIGRSI